MRKALALGLALLSTALLAADKPAAPKPGAKKVDAKAKDAKVEEPKQIPSWFKLRPETADDWTLTPDPADENRFALTLKEPLAKPEESKKVLVLFFKKSSSYDTALGKIADILQDKQIPAVITAINFGVAEVPNDDLGKKALAYAKAEKVDLIYTMGSDSTSWVYKNFKNQTTPVVSVCSKDPANMFGMKEDEFETKKPSNMAFTSLNVPIDVQMTYLKQMKPKLSKIAIMCDKENKSAIKTQVEPLRKAAAEQGIKTIDVMVQDPTKAKEELETLVPQAVEAMLKDDPEGDDSIFWITGSTTVFKEIATIAALAKNIPVLSAVPDVVKEGDASAVLSIGVGFESNAHLAAVYGADILLKKTKPQDMKTGIISPPDIAINFRKARQIGLKIPFNFLESAAFVYDHDGKIVRKQGQLVTKLASAAAATPAPGAPAPGLPAAGTAAAPAPAPTAPPATEKSGAPVKAGRG